MSATPKTSSPRRTPVAAHGEPQVWLTGAAMALAVGAIVWLLALVAWHGLRTFWVAPLDLVAIRAQSEPFLAAPVRDEAYDPGAERLSELRASISAGESPADAISKDGLAVRRLYRVGNREFKGQPFRWVDLADIGASERPDWGVFLERLEWGVWIGRMQAVTRVEERTLPGEGDSIALAGETPTDLGPRRFERVPLGPGEPQAGAPTTRVRETVYLGEGDEQAWQVFEALHPAARERWERLQHIRKREIGDVNWKMEQARLELRKVELRFADGHVTEAELARAKEKAERREQELSTQYDALMAEAQAIERDDARYRLIVTDVESGRFAPIAQTRPDEPMLISQVVRALRPNDLNTGEKWSVYLARWNEFLTDAPREANTEGGVFPVIFGTVLMTLLLCIIVAPLGVIAALYLREYAKQGVLVSIVRTAVNNLAGVPSIVYGVFGLGFFCYTVGAYIDSGPSVPAPAPIWSVGAVGVIALVILAVITMRLAKPRPGQPEEARHRAIWWGGLALWIGAAGLLAWVLATTPYFRGFYRERLPTATFGTKGIIWSALTLALLTLPVVIVATEEAISSVPRSLREASFGCGASRWQTVRRVVLPRAAPGIMTGMILAMARGAGEVAPLMLVGAVKLAPDLPFDHHPPFVHLERSFMHLGFHIYDLGFQSPDSEAARAYVWTTTLLLIAIVAALNGAAIGLRARLRRKFVEGAF
ncbi:MAG: ABC transporter permease subunit [Phycisphaerales bacterium]